MNKDRIKNNFDKMSYNEIIDYVDYLETSYDNLQSKIGKANKYLEEHTDKLGKIRVPKIDFNYNELSDILEED